MYSKVILFAIFSSTDSFLFLPSLTLYKTMFDFGFKTTGNSSRIFEQLDASVSDQEDFHCADVVFCQLETASHLRVCVVEGWDQGKG
jgi:hypothetical protein